MNDINDVSQIVGDISNMDSNIFIWSIIFGIIGMGYFSYGRNQDYNRFSYIGMILMIFPYFVDTEISVILTGIFFIVIPFFSW